MSAKIFSCCIPALMTPCTAERQPDFVETQLKPFETWYAHWSKELGASQKHAA
ncbi:hypothetical protein JQ594_20275 [Bradyrhizobium manausense]|uniref:hypothetical protein n=1 Tax=Bradyrhizobium manausense TaxID=989370 RepID=UPI001BA9055F|nr:hypothetical protein [Bradyrhizobium manausense]MBR0688276.1 hypothetical protein [Bradyrhizobium manausense]